MNGWAIKANALASQNKALKSLEFGHFRSYLLGQGVSAIGTGLQQVALAWLVYRITHSASALATFTAALLAGQALLSFFGGCLADKLDRRELLIKLQWFGAAISFLIVCTVMLQILSLPLILALALLVGSFAAMEYPARQSLIADLVGEDHLVSARGLYSCVCASAIAIGQASGGILIDLIPNFGEAACTGLNACSFIFSLITLKLIGSKFGSAGAKNSINAHSGQSAKAIREEQAAPKILNTRECKDFVLKSPTILLTLLQTAVLVLFGMRYVSLLPAFAAEVFHGGARESGLLTAAVAFGFSVGGLICGSMRQKERLEICSDLSLLLLPLGMFVFCLSSNIESALLSVFMMATVQSVNINSTICLLQMSSPHRLFGRLMGLRFALIAICELIAALVVALVVQNLGLRTTIIAAASFCFVAAIVVFSRRALSQSGKVAQAYVLARHNEEQ